MKIYVSKLPREGVHLRASEPAEIMDMDIENDEIIFEEPIEVDVFPQIVGNTLLVRGTINVRAKLRCSRCLEYCEHTLTRPQYTFSTTVQPGDIIDLTESIREDIIIAFPMKPLCSKDCKGLCPLCGKNLNKGACGCSTSESVPSEKR